MRLGLFQLVLIAIGHSWSKAITCFPILIFIYIDNSQAYTKYQDQIEWWINRMEVFLPNFCTSKHFLNSSRRSRKCNYRSWVVSGVKGLPPEIGLFWQFLLPLIPQSFINKSKQLKLKGHFRKISYVSGPVFGR